MARRRRPPGDLRDVGKWLDIGPAGPPNMDLIRYGPKHTKYVPMRPEDEGLTQEQLKQLDADYRSEQIAREMRQRKLSRKRQPGRGPAFPKR